MTHGRLYWTVERARFRLANLVGRCGCCFAPADYTKGIGLMCGPCAFAACDRCGDG